MNQPSVSTAGFTRTLRTEVRLTDYLVAKTEPCHIGVNVHYLLPFDPCKSPAASTLSVLSLAYATNIDNFVLLRSSIVINHIQIYPMFPHIVQQPQPVPQPVNSFRPYSSLFLKGGHKGDPHPVFGIGTQCHQQVLDNVSADFQAQITCCINISRDSEVFQVHWQSKRVDNDNHGWYW